MKQKSNSKCLSGLRTYVFTLLLALTSFSFVVSEWKIIFRTGESVYQMFKPLVEEWRS